MLTKSVHAIITAMLKLKSLVLFFMIISPSISARDLADIRSRAIEQYEIRKERELQKIIEQQNDNSLKSKESRTQKNLKDGLQQ